MSRPPQDVWDIVHFRDMSLGMIFILSGCFSLSSGIMGHYYCLLDGSECSECLIFVAEKAAFGNVP